MFELREALIRQILFAMENQNVRYLIDTEKGVLIQEELVPPEERPDTQTDPHGRYQDLPAWKSADGFFLMERFLTEIHEPILRDQLQMILLSGNRVFRRFKDTIRESPEIQRRYYRFKYLAMRDVVLEWYNSLRELAGLDTLELGVDEEIEDLTLSEVEIIRLTPWDVPSDLVLRLDHDGFYEMHRGIPKYLVDHLFVTRRERLPRPEAERCVLFGALNPEGELVAFLWLEIESAGRSAEPANGSAERSNGSAEPPDDPPIDPHEKPPPGGSVDLPRDAPPPPPRIARIHQVYVLPEFRGMGIATELISHAQHHVAEGDGVTMVWHGGPDSPALRGLVRATGLRSLGSEYYFAIGG